MVEAKDPFSGEVVTMRHKNSGFTLIELLVVLAIVGVLFSILMPAIAGTKERARIVSCMNNMKQLALAAFMYADDNGEAIPDVQDTTRYLDDEDVYVCPRDSRDGLGSAKPSYTAIKYSPSSLLPSDVPCSLSEAILYVESDKAGMVGRDEISEFSDFALRHDGRTVVLFADGHVFAYGEDQLATLQSMIPKDGDGEMPPEEPLE